MHGEVTGEFILEKDEYRKRLWSQLVETYSKVMYTYETQQQAANIKTNWHNGISIAQIVLTAVSSAGLIGVAIGQTYVAALVSSILAALSLGLNLYSKGAALSEAAARHRAAADGLWPILQGYISLLTDFENMDLEEIRAARRDLQSRTEKQYLNAPRTNKHAYELARKTLKNEEGQSFEKGECDRLLPVELRDDNVQ